MNSGTAVSILTHAVHSPLVLIPENSSRIFIIGDELCAGAYLREKMSWSLPLIIFKVETFKINSIYELLLTSLCCLRNSSDEMPGGAAREMMDVRSQQLGCFQCSKQFNLSLAFNAGIN